ncbi:MAG: radical SAM protein [Candidatus Omnitrophota bacterium]
MALNIDRFKSCDICPRNCRVNRIAGQKGFCQAPKNLIAYTSFLHQGEEPVVSKGKGSGAIFFSGCSLRCAYCQNYKFSHTSKGNVLGEGELAQIMLNLQSREAANINLVTPTHFLPQILNALSIAQDNGLTIPIVYNTSGYEKKEVIEQLRGIVDIYLTDMKYMNPQTAQKYSQAPDYPEVCQESVKEMYKQIKEALIIRCLVLPNHLEESRQILSWIKENTPQAQLSLMSQYQPYFKANLFPEINRSVNRLEYSQIKAFAEELGLNGYIQDFTPEESLSGRYFKPNI